MATVVLVAFGLVLLIACANVANLLLARGRVELRKSRCACRSARLVAGSSSNCSPKARSSRSPEAWRDRCWRGGRFRDYSRGSSRPCQERFPNWSRCPPNLTVLWFALGLTAITAVVFGLVPALQASKADVYVAMKQDGADSGRPPGGWLRGMLVGIQVGVCMVLLISAGLLMRALHSAQTTDPGFQYPTSPSCRSSLRGHDYENDATVVAFRQRLIERIAAMPGVEDVAQVSKIPLSPGRKGTIFAFPVRTSGTKST